MARPRNKVVEDGLDKSENNDFIPFEIQEGTTPVRIRSGPGIDTVHVDGKYLGKGRFLVDSVSDGPGSKSGWGHLANGEGWVGLDFVKIVK